MDQGLGHSLLGRSMSLEPHSFSVDDIRFDAFSSTLVAYEIKIVS